MYNKRSNNKEREFRGTSVEVRTNPGDTDEKKSRAFSSAYRKFKKMIHNEGIIQEYCEKQFFEKPCDKRNRKKAAARRRHLKEVSEAREERGW